MCTSFCEKAKDKLEHPVELSIAFDQRNQLNQTIVALQY